MDRIEEAISKILDNTELVVADIGAAERVPLEGGLACPHLWILKPRLCAAISSAPLQMYPPLG